MLLLMILLQLQGAPPLEQQFLDLERRVVSGLQEQDAVRLETLLADGYVLRGRPDIDRATWIRNAVTLCWGERADIEEFDARDLVGAVITSFVLTMHQDPTTCKPATIRSLITDVWTRQNGDWRLAVRHSGPIGSAGADPVAAQFRREDPPPPRWETTSELSLVSTGGNADTQTLGVGSDVTHRSGVWVTSASGAFVRSSAEGLENVRSLNLQLRQSAQIRPRIDVFGRTGYRRDMFAGIDHRGTVDAGLGFKLIDTAAHQLKVDTGIGYILENRAIGESLSSAILNTVNTWRWQLLDRVTVGNNTGFTMPFEEADAWRATNQLSLTTSLTDMFAVKLSHSANYLNQPVPGFGRIDTVISAALVTTFQRQ